MLEKINKLLKEVEELSISSREQLEEYRIKWLSKKGEITELFEEFRAVPGELKKEIGQKLNVLRNSAQEKINQLKETFDNQVSSVDNKIDYTTPPFPGIQAGSLHPLSIIKNELIDVFAKIGFTVSDGREIEDDWHNFTALNTPENHPARDMQDTFYVNLDPERVLRTQTSSVQVHIMESKKPPIRTISPGRVYRNEAVSARAHCQFHQVEGLYIDEKVSFADLKQTLQHFTGELFGPDTKIRLRPSYFPFTEPSAEMDISCTICKGKGCSVCKQSGWVEILGCGMVDPQVLENCGIDSNKFSGFAFGMGIERIAMLKYRITDLRLFFENDIRFLKQFTSA
ncbi:MAG: phenylalanine--tRNA ligase subunit alpha [Sphingobacteriaceae bacterium]|nr:phenylalanine--tRNA ligase subunit alpha [Sphingobacteriaceae bacterium]